MVAHGEDGLALVPVNGRPIEVRGLLAAEAKAAQMASFVAPSGMVRVHGVI